MAETVDENLVGDAPSVKRKKVDRNSENDTESIHSTLRDLSKFQLTKIVNENSQRKTVCLQGSFNGADGLALLILEKEAFSEDNINGILSETCPVNKEFSNDIYGKYECAPAVKYNGIKATVIHPATEKHIRKYEVQPLHIVQETPELYKCVTLSHLQKERFNLQWVTNILEHKSEADRIVFEDPDPEIGFILLPDLKWDAKQIENLYLVGIVHKLGLLSLRSLTGDHLNLLRNLDEKGTKAIEDRYNISRSQLRVYLHYQPSFYHLHVHFTNLQYDAPGIFTEKSHLLKSVINNIELMTDYYQKATIPFTLKESDNLFTSYEKKGLLRRSPT